jgi:hypothetical protein
LDNSSQQEIEAQHRERQLVRAMMSYLGEHPQAMDTVRGIAEWWFSPQQVQADLETLDKVLQGLVAQGLIEQVDSGNGPLYRLKR